MIKSTKYSLRAALLALSIASAGACGGPAKKGDSPGLPAPSAQEPKPVPPAQVGDSLTVALPTIPASPVSVPEGLMLEASLSNPNSQLTDIGLFMDAVYPGGGAMMSAQMVLQQVESMIGVVGIAGLDLNQAFFTLALDNNSTVLVAKVADAQALASSLKGAQVAHIVHEGFVAVGTAESLAMVAPYALSNLVKQASLPQPTVSIHLENLLKGKNGISLKAALIGEVGAEVGAILITAMEHMPLLQISVQSSQSEAIVSVTALVDGGQVKNFVTKQQPANFEKVTKIGSGPWGIIAGGRLELSLFAPLLSRLANPENPMASEILGLVANLNGEMGLAVNYPNSPEVRLALGVQNGKAVATVLDAIAKVLSKDKALTVEDFKASLRLSAIKNKKGHLHELKLKPGNARQIELLGKKPVFAYFGVVSDTLLGTFGKSAKKSAKKLSSKNGSLAGKGKEIEAALSFAKNSGESFFFALDFEALRGDRDAKDIAPVVGGLRFTQESAVGRLVVPAALVKRMMDNPKAKSTGSSQSQKR